MHYYTSFMLCHTHATLLTPHTQEHNRLSRLPDSISHLSKLEALYVGGNELHELPDCFPSLPSLSVLNASHNRIEVRVPSPFSSFLPFHYVQSRLQLSDA